MSWAETKAGIVAAYNSQQVNRDAVGEEARRRVMRGLEGWGPDYIEDADATNFPGWLEFRKRWEMLYGVPVPVDPGVDNQGDAQVVEPLALPGPQAETEESSG